MAHSQRTAPHITTEADAADIELLCVWAALIPVLAYPFVNADRCASALIFPSSINILYFHVANTLSWAFDGPWIDIPLWVRPLTVLTFCAGLIRAGVIPLKKPERGVSWEDFREPIGLALLTLSHQTVRLCPQLLGIQLDISLYNVASSIACVAGIPHVLISLSEQFMEPIGTILCRFVMRRVSWWFWLPPGDPNGGFQPTWSIASSMFVHTSVPLLVLFSAANQFGISLS